MANDFGRKTYAYLSNEFRPKIDKEGSWTATDSFICPWSTVQSLLPALAGPNPRQGWGFLLADTIEIEPNKADLCKVIVTYSAGGDGDDFDFDDSTKFTYNMSITMSTEDIETHERYRDVPLDEMETISYVKLGSYVRVAKDTYDFKSVTDQSLPVKKLENEHAKELVNLILKGVTSYDLPVQVWSATWTDKVRPKDSLFAAVGTIVEPKGNPPTPDDRNWLMSGMDMEKNGGTYRITIRYSMSGRGGWIKELYDPDAPANPNAPADKPSSPPP